jgi:hypothetical protein
MRYPAPQLRARRSTRAYLVALALSSVAACAITSEVGCGVVDVGPNTGPPEPCMAPSAFFVSDVWPQFFAKYGCNQAACHNAISGRGSFRLYDVSMVTAPMSTAPESAWPFEWQQNFAAVQQNLSCANPTQSVVLTVPEGRGQPHPPGITVTDPTSADALFTMWLQ